METRKCEYCDQERDTTEMNEVSVWCTQSRLVMGEWKFFKGKADKWFCKGKPCLSYFIMAQDS